MTKGDSMVEGLFVLMMYGCLGLCIHVLNAYTNCLAFVWNNAVRYHDTMNLV